MNNKIVEIKYRSYYGKKYILTRAETDFYEVLKEVVGEKNIIFCKVRMEDLIGAKDNKYKQANRNRIKSRHADFAIFNKENLTIRLVVELDDRSHNSSKAREVDKFKDEAYGSAGIKIARIIRKPHYNHQELSKQIIEAYNTEYKIIYHKKVNDTDNPLDRIIKEIITAIKNIFK